jgi:hypothetical protein
MKYKAMIGAFFLLVFANCAGIRGWPEYKAAMNCHLKNGADCTKCYLDTFNENPDLPGLNASYGSYLYSKGNVEEGRKYLAAEVTKFPQSQKAISIILDANSQKPEAKPADSVKVINQQ